MVEEVGVLHQEVEGVVECLLQEGEEEEVGVDHLQVVGVEGGFLPQEVREVEGVVVDHHLYLSQLIIVCQHHL